jgi:hypothetical protein
VTRGRALAVALAALSGCSSGVNVGFGVALTVRFDRSVTDAQVASVRRFEIDASGDETDHSIEPVTRPSGAQRVERLVYRPRKATRHLALAVSAFDGNNNLVAVGATMTLSLTAGKTTVAEAVLLPPSGPDLGADMPDAAVPDDLSAPLDMRHPIPTTLSFPAPTTVMTTQPYVPTLFTSGLVNKDTRPDLVIADNNNSFVTLINDGMGGFPTMPTNNFVGTPVDSLAVADFNRDGVGDYVVGSTSNNGVVLFLSQPAGGYGIITIVNKPGPATRRAVVAADFNGDGFADIAYLGYDALLLGPTVEVLLGNGLGGFPDQRSYTTNLGNQILLAVGDFNADGKPDLVVLDSYEMVQLTNVGGATVDMASPLDLGPPPLFSVGPLIFTNYGSPVEVEVADVAGDSKPDLVVLGNSYASVIKNVGGMLTDTGAIPSVPPGVQHISCGDVDGDGKSELFTLPNTGNVVYYHNNAGTFTLVRTIYVPSASQLLARDLNGDGKADLAVLDGGGRLTVFLASAGNFPTAPEFVTLPAGVNAFATADFNGDGRLDVAVAGSGAVTILLNDGTAAPFSQQLSVTVSSPVSLAVGDFNGDTHPDIAVANTSNVMVLSNTGNGDPDGGGALFNVLGPFGSGAVTDVGVGDVNKDGKDDLVYTNATANQVGVLINDGMGGFSGPTLYGAGTYPTHLVVADLNGDARVDVAAACQTSHDINVLINGSSGILGSATSFGSLSSGYATLIATGQFNTDKLDLTFAATSSLGVLLNSGNGSYPALVQPVMMSVGGLAVADFNVDGKADIAFTNTGGAANPLGILLGGGNGTFGTPKTFNAGPGLLAAGDFDGDGLPDLVLSVGGGFIYLHNQSM